MADTLTFGGMTWDILEAKYGTRQHEVALDPLDRSTSAASTGDQLDPLDAAGGVPLGGEHEGARSPSTRSPSTRSTRSTLPGVRSIGALPAARAWPG